MCRCPLGLSLVPYTALFRFFFNDTATTEIYTLSLHDALPISCRGVPFQHGSGAGLQPRAAGARSLPSPGRGWFRRPARVDPPRSEEHTSELQSRQYLVCRLLLEKKKTHI